MKGCRRTDATDHARRAGPRLGPWVLALVLAAFARASAAADCLDPLVNPEWACTAELSSGETVDYCVNLKTTSGSGPSRTFDMVTTGPYPRTCTCGARGRVPGARYGEDKTYLCFDATTDTVESGKIAKKKITGETYNVSQNVRGKFKCRVDPACVVPQ